MRSIFLLSFSLAACGGGSPSIGVDTADGGSMVTGKDAGSSDKGDAASGPSFALPYLPLDPGLSWTYKSSQADKSIGTSCENNGTALTVTMGAVTSDGAHPAMYSPACFYSEVDYVVTGTNVTEDGYLVFEFPPTQGEMWTPGGSSGSTYAWDQHFDTYTVAAGTFSDCWHLSINGGGYEEVLCRDVGLVLSSGTQFQNYRWELTSKSF